MDAFEVLFQSRKIAGHTSGMEMGREAEKKRWTDTRHFTNGTCHSFSNPFSLSIHTIPQDKNGYSGDIQLG
jgi:hypothetical protein